MPPTVPQEDVAVGGGDCGPEVAQNEVVDVDLCSRGYMHRKGKRHLELAIRDALGKFMTAVDENATGLDAFSSMRILLMMWLARIF